VRVESPGGGGYGSPVNRELADIERDLRQGMISEAGAERDYGVTVAADGKVTRMTT
jgi:N-methylhydantoinase B